MLDFEYKNNGGDIFDVSNYNVKSIDLMFSDAVLLPSGKLAGSVLTIELKDPVDWAVFRRDWIEDGVQTFDDIFHLNTFTFKNAGQSSVSKLLGLSFEADTSRSVAIGSDGDDTITIADGTGDWVIQGNNGDDTMTLSNGAEEVVYTVNDDHDASSLTTTDGSDTINDFSLGTDSLRFVDTNGAVPTLDGLMSRMTSVAVSYDGGSSSYTGVKFAIDSSNTLTVNFDAAHSVEQLKTAFGITSAGNTDLNAAFTSGNAVPSAAGDIVLNSQGLDYVDDLFGDEISVSDTIPTELL